MDVYGAEVFRIDDLLDLSNEEMFSSSTGSSSNKTTNYVFDLNHQYHHPPHSDNINPAASYYDPLIPNSADFTDKLCVPVSTVTYFNINKLTCLPLVVKFYYWFDF